MTRPNDGNRPAASPPPLKRVAGGPPPPPLSAITKPDVVPPPPYVDTEWVDVPWAPPPAARPNGGFPAEMIIGGSLLALLGLVAVGTVAYFTVQSKAKEQSLKTIQDYAANEPGAKAPSAEDVRRVIGRPSNGAPTPDDAALESFNQALSSQNVERAGVGDADKIRTLLDAVIALQTKNAADSLKDWPLLIGKAYSGKASLHLAATHENAFKDFNDFRKSYYASVIAVRSADVPSRGATVTGTGAPANTSTAANSAAAGKPDPSAAQQSGQQENKSQRPLAATATFGVAESGVLSEQAQQAPAFIDLQTSIATFKSKRQDIWPLDASARNLFSLNAVHARRLGVDVIVGNSGDFKPHADRSDSPPHGALQQWTISVDDKPRLTLIFDGDYTLKASTASGSSNPSSDDPLRFLPIGFKFPNAPAIGDNWFRLSQSPVALNLSTTDAGPGIPDQATLHDVLCKTGKAALPFPKLYGTDTRWELSPRVVSAPDSSITLTITPVAVVEPTTEPAFVDLLFTGTVTSGTTRILCSLRKRLALTVQYPCTITNETPPWGDTLELLYPIDQKPSPDTAETERKWLGLHNEKDSLLRKSEIDRLIVALLRNDEYFKGLVPNDAGNLLCGWALETDKDLRGKSVHNTPGVAKAYETVLSLRETLVEFLTNNGEFQQEHAAEFEATEKRPPEPGSLRDEPKPYQRRKDLPGFQTGGGLGGDDIFRFERERRQYDTEKMEYEKKVTALDDWKKKRDSHVVRAIESHDLLKKFWETHNTTVSDFKKDWLAEERKVGPAAIVRELAAIKCLLELDSLLLVKFHREKLEELLRRVPVGALFQGQITQIWELDGKPFPPVVAYELIPGDLLPPTTTAPAQGQADGGAK